jgi:hypothetical protein
MKCLSRKCALLQPKYTELWQISSTRMALLRAQPVESLHVTGIIKYHLSTDAAQGGAPWEEIGWVGSSSQ